MEGLLNLAEIAGFGSVAGVFCMHLGARVPPSESWQESAAAKRALLLAGGLALQIPVALVVIFKPAYVTGYFEIEDFSFERLLIIYAVAVGFFVLGLILNRFLP